jgi:hypothetical protein
MNRQGHLLVLSVKMEPLLSSGEDGTAKCETVDPVTSRSGLDK